MAKNVTLEQDLNDQQQRRREKLDLYREMGIDPFGCKYDVNSSSLELKSTYSYLKAEECDENTLVKIAGRIVLLRKMGKASFITLQDRYGKIQCYIRQDVVGEDNYKVFKLADLGDICAVEGYMMKTKTGEITIRANRYVHLTKALRPLPDKFHGLQDPEDRRRKRYVDLIVNDDSREVAFMRPKIIRGIQNFMDKENFVEVETSILQPILGGANARPFITHHNALEQDFYLRIATELSLKRLIVGGMDRVYEIGRMFRNEGIDTTHNPEFTTMEAYQAFGDLSSMADLTERLIRYLAKNITRKSKIKWLRNEIDLDKPFKHATMNDLVKEKTGIDFKEVDTFERAKELAIEHHIEVENHFKWGHILNAFFEKYVEETLIQPTFVYGHPLDVSPLARKSADPRYTERFELFISTKEICNAFTELNDPLDQRERFEAQVLEKNNGNEEACEVDDDFIEALEYGLPPTGGIGYGIDRMIMMLLEKDSIRDVLLFPTLKRR